MARLSALLFVVIVMAMQADAQSVGVDQDRDGLPDDIEQSLLVRFAPAFEISASECDEAPAELLPGSRRPQIVARNGTIYGQVSRIDDRFLEIHYYHLWSRDCGRIGHALDAEHVSALIDASSRKAIYWYAAAHQETICDSSSGATAAALGAEDHGPSIWISRGKHASFLGLDACSRGCGGDRCERMTPLARAKLINIGEPGALLNGAVWAESELWPLAAKMKPDFTDAVIAQLRDSTGVVSVSTPRRPVQAVIAASGGPIDAVATGNRHTASALSVAETKTDRALDTSAGHVGRSLNIARRTAARWLKTAGF